MKGLKKTAIIIIIIGGLLFILPIAFYIVNFSHRHLASDPSVWGVFGDFIGGSINPIFSFLNLALLAAISIYVAKFDNHRQFNEYRYQAYLELCKYFDKTNETAESLVEFKENITNYSFNNQFLYPQESNKIFNEILKELIINIEKLIPLRDEHEDNVRTGEIKEYHVEGKLARELVSAFKNIPATENEVTRALNLLNESKKRLLGFIQAVMIESDIKKYRHK